MGCEFSYQSYDLRLFGEDPYVNFYLTHTTIAKSRDIFTSLGMDEYDIARLHELFSTKIDTDSSGVIEILELLMFLDVDRTRFTRRVLGIFDDDGSGFIDFEEFVFSIWNYCTLGPTSLVLFAFDLYDEDNNGYIDKEEALNLIKDVYGSKFEQNIHAKLVYNKLEALELTRITLAVFQDFAKKHQAALFPAFQIQTLFKEKVLGDSFWRKISNFRMSKFKETYVPIAEVVKTLLKFKEAKKTKYLRQFGGIKEPLVHVIHEAELDDDLLFYQKVLKNKPSSASRRPSSIITATTTQSYSENEAVATGDYHRLNITPTSVTAAASGHRKSVVKYSNPDGILNLPQAWT